MYFYRVKFSGVECSLDFKGGYIAQSKLLKIHFMVLSNRVGQDNFVGTGMTVKLGLVCLPDTEQKSKIRFSQIAYSGHVTCFDVDVFVQGSAKKSGLQCAIIKLGLSGRHRCEIRPFLTINRFFGCQIYSNVQNSQGSPPSITC